MMLRAWHDSPYMYVVIGFHVCVVVFLLVEITFNYFMCVTTRNFDPRENSPYDKVVHELAEVTEFRYPETPEEVTQYKHEYNDKMMLRMKRRSEINHQRLNGGNAGGNEVTQRKKNNGSSNNSSRKQRPIKLPNPKQVRNWMLMAPDEWGYCSRSHLAKPPRSHYDHVTKTLVLCLDHYCPWMFNSIGYFNYRYFCNFLWYVELGMMYGAYMTYGAFMNCSGPYYRKQVMEHRKTGTWTRLYPYTPIPSERTPITLSFMLCLAVGIAVACLGGFHLYLTLTSQTTIEFHGNLMNKAQARRLGQKYRNPYDLGWRRNLQQVFGFQLPFWLAFLIPSTREPEFLPLPMNGEDGKRKHLRKRHNDTTTAATVMAVIDEEYTETSGADEEADSLLPSASRPTKTRTSSSTSNRTATTTTTASAADVSIV
eukprot:CAMPEP_0113485224 /NCGR_PEP_ID=MMETSP0014_2-20120614/24372_1 /TAXON_ID=2857 /ORGANISM="Nitzschia sp." /LENGTH=424 /DNA_ID=CAMNT_0000378861 /DNA_START=375 /DNA_END=1649 /DNA_ORIENTATION=- /assembly_acc=CAM_ASM_000159